MSIKTKITSKKSILIMSAAIIIALGGAVFYVSGKNDRGENQTENTDDINYSPPSEEEKATTEKNKASVVKRQDLETNSSNNQQENGTKKDITPVISSWGQNLNNKNVEVTGYIPGVYENGGTCTLTLERSGKKVTGKHAAHKDAQTTACGLITVERSALSRGAWKAVIFYSSPVAQGTSKAVNIGVE